MEDLLAVALAQHIRSQRVPGQKLVMLSKKLNADDITTHECMLHHLIRYYHSTTMNPSSIRDGLLKLDDKLGLSGHEPGAQTQQKWATDEATDMSSLLQYTLRFVRRDGISSNNAVNRLRQIYVDARELWSAERNVNGNEDDSDEGFEGSGAEGTTDTAVVVVSDQEEETSAPPQDPPMWPAISSSFADVCGRVLQRHVSAPPTCGAWVGRGLDSKADEVPALQDQVAEDSAPRTPPRALASDQFAETPCSKPRVGRVIPHELEELEELPEFKPLMDMGSPDADGWPSPPPDDDDKEVIAHICKHPPVDHVQHKAERLLAKKKGKNKKPKKKGKNRKPQAKKKGKKKMIANKPAAASAAEDNKEEPRAPTLKSQRLAFKRPAAALEPEEKFLRAMMKSEHDREFVQIMLCGFKAKPLSMGCISNLDNKVAWELAEQAISMVDPNNPDVKQKFKEALATVRRQHHEPN